MRKSSRNAAIVMTMAFLILISSTDIFACSRIDRYSFNELLVADVIVLATATKYVKEPGESITTGRPDAEVEFKIEEVLRGKKVPKTITLNAYLSGKDDFNDMPVPYTFVRKNGRSGSCFANTYREGGNFLLFLRKTEAGYTTNISALGPSNEQVRGPDDPWVSYTREALANLKQH